MIRKQHSCDKIYAKSVGKDEFMPLFCSLYSVRFTQPSSTQNLKSVEESKRQMKL